ncbi:MAG: hypothetical protein FWD49_02520 [Firmicutes bacterium]|nr:hypothetical protein [Bacillota bacterium]
MITLSRKSGQLIWLEVSNVPANTEVMVSEQGQALVVGNGAVQDILYPGKTIVNPKMKKGIFSSAPIFDRCDILGVDTSVEVEIPWGVGGVEFMDEVLKCPGTIQASGSCAVKISDGRKLYRKFFDGQNAVSADFLLTKLRPILCDKIKGVFYSVANRCKDISLITGAAIEKDIEDNLYLELRDNYGLTIVSIRYRINGHGLDEMISKLGEKAKTGIDKDISQNNAESKKAEAEGLKATAEAIKAFSSDPKKEGNGQNTIKLKKD